MFFSYVFFIAALCMGSLPVYAENSGADSVTVTTPVYPRIIETPDASITINMPDINSWENYEILTAWVAIEVKPMNSEDTWIGSIKFKAKSDIDFNERVVVLYDLEVIDQKFHDNIEPPRNIKEIARTAISLKPRSVPLDFLLRALPEDFKGTPLRPGPDTIIKSDPPQIYVSTKPAALMIINGEVLKAPIKDAELEFVVNTNWDLFYHKSNKSYYLLNGDSWQQTDSLTKPEWQSILTLPEDFNDLPDDGNWEEVKKQIPAKSSEEKPPLVIISLEPSELILIDGDPQPETIEGTGIRWITNTDSDLFLYKAVYYYLVSGRWFQSKKLDGKWASVEKLPEDFAAIPSEHLKGHVLASIPGTEEARVASIEAQIPRRAKISVSAGEEVDVIYDGEPEFVSIEGTDMQRA